jgi:hypothetical protein
MNLDLTCLKVPQADSMMRAARVFQLTFLLSFKVTVRPDKISLILLPYRMLIFLVSSSNATCLRFFISILNVS